jgi:hypothetical protein
MEELGRIQIGKNFQIIRDLPNIYWEFPQYSLGRFPIIVRKKFLPNVH